MDKEILVEQLQNLISKFASEEKDFVLVMLIPVDSGLIDTKYTLLFSANWLDTENPKEAVNFIVKAIIDQLGSPDTPEFRLISRVTVIKTIDPFVRAITSAFNVNSGIVNISNFNINGIQIENGIILASHKPTLNISNTQKHGSPHRLE
jgi:hypothetical protein